MSNVYYDGNRYYKLDENGNRVFLKPRSNEDRTHDLVRKSTTGNRTSSKPRTVKVYVDKAKKALVILCTLCIMVGAALTNMIGNAIESWQDNSYVYDMSTDFRKNALYDNTHRTMDNEHYWYDYDRINDYMEREGADYSREVYFAYRNIGEQYTGDLLVQGAEGKYGDSLQEFVEREGYKTIEDWCKAEKKQILLEKDVKDKQAELQAMAGEIEEVSKQELGVGSDNYGK